MKKLYFSFFPFLLTACATQVDYIGATYAPSQQVAVFVSKDAVKKDYEVIGKGYARMGSPMGSIEKIQKKAVSKARQKGADAVIIEDYFVLQQDNSITTALRSDSSSLLSIAGGGSHPTIASGFQILFIRYRP